MGLEHVSSRFDLTPVWDAYTGEKLAAKCQLTAWDTPRRDGLTTIRRTLYTAQNYKLPARCGLIFAGAYWIAARLRNPDAFGRHNPRVGYVVQQAYPAKRGNVNQVLSNTTTEVLLSRVWVKDVKDITSDSEFQGQYYVYFTEAERIGISEFLFVDGRWHIVRGIVSGTAGLMIAECNELAEDCIVNVEVQAAAVYDPVTESYSNGSDQTIPAVFMEWRDEYVNELPSNEKEQTGDKRIRVSNLHGRLLGMDTRLKIRGTTWQVTGLDTKADGSVSAALRRV